MLMRMADIGADGIAKVVENGKGGSGATQSKEKVVAKGRSETDEEEVDAASDSSFSMAEFGRNLGFVTD